MARQWWIGVLCVLTLTSVLLARQGIIKTKDGRTIEGDIDDTPTSDNVIVTIRGVKTTLPRSNVDSITYTGNFEQEFQQKLNKLASNDAQGRIDLARWAFDNRQYELARQAVLEAQKIDPRNTDAPTLLETIQSTMAMESKRGTAIATPPPPPATADNTNTTATPIATGPAKYLTNDDINKIRQAELQAADKTIRVSFTNNVRERYLSTGDKDSARFNALSSGEQALELIQTNDPNITKDVHILGDPVSLLEYRTKIQLRLLAGCAASGCHGGPNGGNFFLYPNADQTPAWYTNYYILQTYTKKLDIPGGFTKGPVTRSMVDRTQPAESLLLQYGRPLSVAMTAHPKVPGWKPMFVTDQDPTYQTIFHWMSQTLKPFAPDYGIKFDLPTGKPTTQPTTEPAAAPAP